jgi:hypothetical protein
MKTTLALVAAALLSLPSCTVHLGADGSKDVSVDAPSALTALQILAEK